MTDDLDAAIGALRDRIVSVPSDGWLAQPAGEGWTVGQVLHHAITGLTYNADLMFRRPRLGEPIRSAEHDAFIATTEAFSTTSADPLLALLDEHASRMRTIFEAGDLGVPYRLTFASGNIVDYSGERCVESAIHHIHEHIGQATD